ncbi:hypothetical protein ACFRKB_35185 [Streptomyces scopuliridis]|uniref:hypothetical protein n=1 Tax=Streptomyces scopuliridis TaxID=452529 RepID=UPI00368ECE53
MKNAREKRPHGPGRLVSAGEIGPEPETFQRPLICQFCVSPVGPVRGYKTVPNLFRLLKGALHEPGCELNPTEFIQDIARGSHGLAHITDQKFLRLELPERIDAMPPYSDPNSASAPEDPVRKRDTTTVRPYLPPAITSAAKIARFLQLHGFNPDTVSRFRVKPHGQRAVPWDRFCYGPSEHSYAALYERLQAGSPITHPIAVHGTVQQILRDKNGGLYTALAVNAPAGDQRFHILLRSPHETLIHPLTVGTHVLAVGNWGIFEGSFTPHLRMFADQHWQIAYWTTDEHTGRLTEPSCPPSITSRQRVAAQTEDRKRRLEKQRPTIPPEAPPTAPANPAPASPAETAPPSVSERREQPDAPEPQVPLGHSRTEPSAAARELPPPVTPERPPMPPPPPIPPLQPPPEAAKPTRRRGLLRWFERRR